MIVGTMSLRSILWMAAAETSARSASCCRESRCSCRSAFTFGPMELTIASTCSSLRAELAEVCLVVVMSGSPLDA